MLAGVYARGQASARVTRHVRVQENAMSTGHARDLLPAKEPAPAKAQGFANALRQTQVTEP